MAIDSDLVGVIVACSVVVVCLCVLIVLASCVCFRRLEDKRRQAEKRRAHDSILWAAYPPPAALPPALGDGDGPLEQTRIGGYRPRILSPGSPRSSAIFTNNNNNTSSLPKIKNGSSNQQSPRHSLHHQSSTPLYSNSLQANGQLLVPISLAAAHHYRMAAVPSETPQDFYDARAASTAATSMPIRPFQIHDEFMEFYPDVPYDSLGKRPSQQERTVDTGLASHNSNSPGDSNKLQQSPSSDQQGVANQESLQPDERVDETIGEIKTPDLENNHSNESATNNKEEPPKPMEETTSDHQDNASTSNFKVIKKQHGHAKMPEWMVREYEEAESSIEVEEEEAATAPRKADENLALQEGSQMPGMVSVMVGDYSIPNGTATDPSGDANTTTTTKHVVVTSFNSNTVEESTTSIIQDYSSTNYIKDFTILDYVEPLPPPPSHIMDNIILQPNSPRFNDNSNIDDTNDNNNNNNDDYDDDDDEDDDGDKAIRQKKAAVLKQIRQKVNESAEKSNPVFTSTPRADPDLVESSPSPNEDVLSKRQRHENDGSLDALPPAVGDTKL